MRLSAGTFGLPPGYQAVEEGKVLLNVELSRLRCLKSWKDARDASLLQFPGDTRQEPWLGVKCFYANSGNRVDRVLRLEDKRAGYLEDPPADAAVLDLTDDVDICAESPALTFYQETRVLALYWHINDAVFICGRDHWFICLRPDEGQDRQFELGLACSIDRPSDLREIGKFRSEIEMGERALQVAAERAKSLDR
jgi:hypothetical protein